MSSIGFFVLAFVQGITEFIPISSSGHLALLQRVLGFAQPMLGFDILLHVATMLAVVIFTRRELSAMARESVQAGVALGRGMSVSQAGEVFPQARLAVYLGWAFLPAVAVGFWAHRFFEGLAGSGIAVGIGFLVTGVILSRTRHSQADHAVRPIRITDALTVGMAQAIAMAPGVSRSGMTIAAGMFRGWERMQAARFSFLLSIPTIAAAGTYHVYKDGWQMPDCGPGVVAVSFMIAGISGYVALAVLSRLVAKARFHYFGYYCVCVGVVTLLFVSSGTLSP